MGNPPFGDQVVEHDEDHLGSNELVAFAIARGRSKVDSEQVILERCINWLEPSGRLGLILPDGLLNNQGFNSNCPQTRSFVVRHGYIEAIISLSKVLPHQNSIALQSCRGSALKAAEADPEAQNASDERAAQKMMRNAWNLWPEAHFETLTKR